MASAEVRGGAFGPGMTDALKQAERDKLRFRIFEARGPGAMANRPIISKSLPAQFDIYSADWSSDDDNRKYALKVAKRFGFTNEHLDKLSHDYLYHTLTKTPRLLLFVGYLPDAADAGPPAPGERAAVPSPWASYAMVKPDIPWGLREDLHNAYVDVEALADETEPDAPVEADTEEDEVAVFSGADEMAAQHARRLRRAAERAASQKAVAERRRERAERHSVKLKRGWTIETLGTRSVFGADRWDIRGIGRLTLDAVTHAARAEGVRALWLYAVETRATEGFYQALGWEPVANRPNCLKAAPAGARLAGMTPARRKAIGLVSDTDNYSVDEGNGHILWLYYKEVPV